MVQFVTFFLDRFNRGRKDIFYKQQCAQSKSESFASKHMTQTALRHDLSGKPSSLLVSSIGDYNTIDR